MAKRIIYFDISEISESKLKSIGIYKIINTITKDFYIGSATRNFKERFKEHSRYYEQWKNKELKRSHHPILWNAFNKYDISNFKIEILKELNGKTKEEILKEEENFILLLKPVYNICQNPTVGGSPNKGKKLSEEWKNNISEKSKKYKHSEETLKKVTQNNKNNANRIELTKDEECLTFNSWKECSEFFKITSGAIQNAFKRSGKFKDYKIKVISKQSKTIKVFKDKEELIFISFSECDKYFNMWRGYTSTLVNKKSKNLIIDKYKFELI